MLFTLLVLFLGCSDESFYKIEERNPEELSHVEGIDQNNEVTKVRIYPKKRK